MINSPLEFSDCVIWLDGSDVSTMGELSSTGVGDVVNGDPVGLWQNKVSPFVRNFSSSGQANSTRPTYISSLSCLRFIPNQFLTDSTLTPLITSQTIFMMLSIPTSQSEIRAFTQIRPGDTNDFANPGFVRAVGINGTNFYFYGEGAARISAPLPSLNTINICCAHHSGNLLRYFVNGVSGGTFSPTTTLSQSASNTRIGSGFTTGLGAFNSFTGNISEVIVYNRALTDFERADVEYYLTRKWNFLNSIPRQVYGIKNGLWSLTDTWSVSAEPSPWNFPLSADNAYTNTFTITADSSTKVSTIRNSALSPNIAAGGSFVLANGVSLSADLRESSAPCLVTFNPSTIATIVGNLFPLTTTSPLVSCRNNSSLTIVGNSNSTNGGWNIINSSGCNLTIFGNVFNSSNSGGQFSFPNILNSGICTIFGQVSGFASNNDGVIRNSGTLNIFGNVSSGAIWFRGLTIAAGLGGTTNIVGNLFFTISPNDNQGGILSGGYGQTITCNVTGNLGSHSVGMYNGGYIVSVVGNLIPEYSMGCISGAYPMTGLYTLTVRNGILGTNQLGGYAVGNCSSLTLISGTAIGNNIVNAVGMTSTGVATLCSSNIINAPNGRQAIYGPNIRMFPGTSPTYTRHAVNGYDSFVDYWTSNATFSYPPVSSVRLNETYANSLSTGTMSVPPPSSVCLHVPVDAQNIPITNIIPNRNYRIVTPGNTNFISIGSPNNNRGTVFTATASTTGTGIVSTVGEGVLLNPMHVQLSNLSLTGDTIGSKIRQTLTMQALSSFRIGTSFTQPEPASLFQTADYWSDNLVWNDSVWATLSAS